MSKYLDSHKKLLQCHGRSITCKIEGVYVDDAKICVGGQPNHNVEEIICVCCSMKKHHGIASPQTLLGYKQAICISQKGYACEYENGYLGFCKELQLKEQTQYLTIGQAIDYMLESENNVIEYYDVDVEWKRTHKQRIVNKELEYLNSEWGKDGSECTTLLKNWTKIRKHIEPIEPKQKTIKEKLEAKEPFKFNNRYYRFNKNGAVIMKKGSKAVSLKAIQEILKSMEE